MLNRPKESRKVSNRHQTVREVTLLERSHHPHFLMYFDPVYSPFPTDEYFRKVSPQKMAEVRWMGLGKGHNSKEGRNVSNAQCSFSKQLSKQDTMKQTYHIHPWICPICHTWLGMLSKHLILELKVINLDTKLYANQGWPGAAHLNLRCALHVAGKEGLYPGYCLWRPREVNFST